MEIIKRVNARTVWVRIDDTLAELITSEDPITDPQAIAKGQAKKEKRDRLKVVRAEIKRLKGG